MDTNNTNTTNDTTGLEPNIDDNLNDPLQHVQSNLDILKYIIAVIGILGNGGVIFVLLKAKAVKKEATNILVINQSAIDFIASFLLLAQVATR